MIATESSKEKSPGNTCPLADHLASSLDSTSPHEDVVKLCYSIFKKIEKRSSLFCLPACHINFHFLCPRNLKSFLLSLSAITNTNQSVNPSRLLPTLIKRRSARRQTLGLVPRRSSCERRPRTVKTTSAHRTSRTTSKADSSRRPLSQSSTMKHMPYIMRTLSMKLSSSTKIPCTGTCHANATSCPTLKNKARVCTRRSKHRPRVSRRR